MTSCASIMKTFVFVSYLLFTVVAATPLQRDYLGKQLFGCNINYCVTFCPTQLPSLVRTCQKSLKMNILLFLIQLIGLVANKVS